MSKEIRDASGRCGLLLAPVFFLIGLFARLAPLFDPGGRLLRQFPTEDGYLMLTIARNLALGQGMSTAAGTLPTNGTQPLATFLWALCYRLTGGDKIEGVRWVLAFELLLATLTAWLIYRFAGRVFEKQRRARELALVAAGVWYASPIVLPHTMNCLESGLYVCVISAALAYAVSLSASSERPRIGSFLVLGAILGVAFWARNDAVLFCAALGITHLAGVFPGGAKAFRHRFVEIGSAGILVVIMALPWLVFNYQRFGSIMPISGQAESLYAKLAENLNAVPVNAFEYLALVVPVPRSFDDRPWVIAATSVVLLSALVTLLARGRHWGDSRFSVSIFATVLLALFGAFYGLYFGAGHFMSRYLLVLSPLSALLWSSLALGLGAALGEHWLRRLTPLVLLGAGVLPAILNLRGYRLGAQHQHFQVVEWVQENVTDAVWVGAVQSGALGYFHDRTLNLDGKVNPEALAAHKAGTILQYTVDSKAEYLVDWIGITSWLKPPLSNSFNMIISDPERNLAVLQRKQGSELVGR